MKTLRLELNVSNPGDKTHIWFPAPQGKFSQAPTETQTDKKYGNKIAYFYFSKKERTVFSFEIATSSPPTATQLRAGTPRNDGNLGQFLRPNRFIQSDDKTTFHLAKNLAADVKTDEGKASRCFDFVVNYLTYANPIRGLYSSLQALTDRGVDCGGFSTLLVALLRAVRIPARCVFGWAIKSKFGYHAWVEYFDRWKNSWIPMDPSVAHLGRRTKLDAGFGFINDDRVSFSVGEDIELIGRGFKWTTPLLQSPVVVSLDNSGVPKPISENLKWSVS